MNLSEPTFSIPTPCVKKWDELQEIDQHCTKYCSACKQKVYDISGMDREVVERLYQQKGGDLCVRMPIEQKDIASKRFNFLSYFKSGLRWALMSFALFVGSPILAQKFSHKQYCYEQVDTKSNTIVLSGEILRPKGKNWRKLKRVFIQINNGSSLELVEAKWLDSSLGFIMELEKEKLGSHFTIIFERDNYASLIINNIPSKNHAFLSRCRRNRLLIC